MSLLAGVGVREVTPQYPMYLAGYPHTPRISTGVHDPLYASALCLNNGADRVMLIATDILFMTPDTARTVRQRISAATGIPEAAIFVSCSHTHSGPLIVPMLAWLVDPTVPTVDAEYEEFFVSQIVAAAQEAAGAEQPAELAWTTADGSGVGTNRLSPTGVTDPEVGVLVVRGSESHRILALSVIYGMHPTVLHEDSTLISSDFPGYTRQALQAAFGQEMVVLYHTAPSGNQSPRYSVKAQTFAEAERLGSLLGERIRASIEVVEEGAFTQDVALGGLLDQVTAIPREMPSLAEAEAILRERVATYQQLQHDGAGHGPVRTAECAVFGAEETVALAKAAEGRLAEVQEAYSKADVQALRIGSAVLVGMPAEIFTEYTLALKARVAGQVFPVTLVNGELHGYVVTPEALAEGGYEAMNSLFTPETGDLFVDAGARLATRLLAQPVAR